MSTDLTIGNEATVVSVAPAEVASEQLRYATFLQYASWTGIGVMIVTFFMYISGAMPVRVKPALMPLYWGLRAKKYVALTHGPLDWGWLGMLHYGDFFALLGLAFMAAVSILGYFFILLPAYAAKKDKIFTVLVVIEVLVLSLAASGVLVH